MKKLISVISLFLFSSITYAVDTPYIVYRCDTRPMDEINQQGGFFPISDTGLLNYNLLNHFSGEQIPGYSSGLVSVSYSLKEAIGICIFSSSALGDVYLYRIVPGNNFYSVSTSLAAARDRFPQGDIRRNNIERIIDHYDTMDEYVAVNGFPRDRVANYAVFTQELYEPFLNGQQDISTLYSEEFWNSRWVANPTWNGVHFGESASSDIYTFVGEPPAEIAYVTANDMEIPARFSCQADRGSPTKRELLNETCHIFPIKKKIIDSRLIYNLTTQTRKK